MTMMWPLTVEGKRLEVAARWAEFEACEAAGGGRVTGEPSPQSGDFNDHDRDLDYRPHPFSDAARVIAPAAVRQAVSRAADPSRRRRHRAAGGGIQQFPSAVLAASRPPAVRGRRETDLDPRPARWCGGALSADSRDRFTTGKARCGMARPASSATEEARPRARRQHPLKRTRFRRACCRGRFAPATTGRRIASAAGSARSAAPHHPRMSRLRAEQPAAFRASLSRCSVMRNRNDAERK